MSTITVTNIKATGETASRVTEGVAAASVSMNETTPAINGSFNTSSLTDLGTGNFQPNWTNAMGNVNYAMSHIGGSNNTVNPGACHAQDNLPNVSYFKFFSKKFDGGVIDMHYVGMVAHGDLA